MAGHGPSSANKLKGCVCSGALGSVALLQGACWRTPDHVRQEWAVQHGCGTFVSEDYDEALDAVCKRLGVRDSGFDYGWVVSVLHSAKS